MPPASPHMSAPATPARQPSSPAPFAQRTISMGDRDLLVLSRSATAGVSSGSRGARQTRCIPGYTGHISGKVAENVHGESFGSENLRASQELPVREMRRTASLPDRISAPRLDQPCGMTVAPRVPGYAGAIPGKSAESVHGMSISRSNEAAQSLRSSNPHVSCDGWMKRGKWPADRMATYKFTANSQRADTHSLFTDEQEAASSAMNRKLGQTFGLKPKKEQRHDSGDPPPPRGKRFLHYHTCGGGLHYYNSDGNTAAGTATHARSLEQERWRIHSALVLTNGNQRIA